jgi:hypothetical protein
MTIFFSEYSKWEYDFIANELLAGINLENKNVLVINHATDIEKVRELVDKHDPHIVFHLSDEHGSRPEWLELFSRAKYVFRQYNHAHYNYPANSYQMPLGYASGYRNYKSLMKPIVERMYSAAFIGELKSDRFDMFTEFERNMDKSTLFFRETTNNWELTKLKFSPSATNEVYSDAIFVPIGRGNESLDCFRLYEAIVSGAVPVIVGRENEINITFRYHGYMPSFIYSPDWDEASKVCRELMKQKTTVLQNIQNYNNEWWKVQIQIIRDKIISSLD